MQASCVFLLLIFVGTVHCDAGKKRVRKCGACCNMPPAQGPGADIDFFPEICGVKGAVKARVHGGRDAFHGELPWMALLGSAEEGNYFCGGAVINQRYVLSASHCVKTDELTDISVTCVRLGETDKLNDDDGQVDYGIASIHAHKDYEPATRFNDIALIRLNSLVYFTRYISPICLPHAGDPDAPAGVNVSIAGWGSMTTNAGEAAQLLQTADIKLTDMKKCSTTWGDLGTNLFYCAVLNGVDACAGDSGGPLMYQKEISTGQKRFFQIGVVSFGDEHCIGQRPGLYSKVVSFLPWMKGIMTK